MVLKNIIATLIKHFFQNICGAPSPCPGVPQVANSLAALGAGGGGKGWVCDGVGKVQAPAAQPLSSLGLQPTCAYFCHVLVKVQFHVLLYASFS